jgi:hypothetical protein
MPTRRGVPVNSADVTDVVEEPQNHCHYLRRGRAEEMAGAVQGNLAAEVMSGCPTLDCHSRSGETAGRFDFT